MLPLESLEGVGHWAVRYVLNSAVITAPGVYRYVLLSRKQVGEWIRRRDYTSRVGYPAVVRHPQAISGRRVELSREPHRMEVGDEALVVRLKYRVDNPAAKGELEPSDEDWEYGLLVREA